MAICNFSRFISLTPVESLSKESIINAFENHFHRFGRSLSIETDVGTSLSAAKADLEAGETLDQMLSGKSPKVLKVLEFH